jgi:septal ring-binding cell division protein DamX
MSSKCVSILAVLVMAAPQAFANSEVQRLLDSYTIAKVDTEQSVMNDAEAQKTPYTIQVASYINEKDAASHVEELKLQEKDVMYFPAFVRGQVWFKVSVGKFESKQVADEYRKKFVKRMDEPFAVVISMLERPKATDDKRMPASVAVKETTPVAVTEPMEAPVPAAAAAVTKPEAKMDVVLKPVPKAEAAPVAKVGGKSYTLQVGAFPSEELAKTKMTALSLKDQEAYIQSATVNGKQWFRVNVGKFTTKRSAEEFQKSFGEQNKGTDSLIRNVE